MSRRKKVYQKEKYFKLKSRRLERGKILILAAFLTEYFVLLIIQDLGCKLVNSLIFLAKAQTKSITGVKGKNRWQSLVPHIHIKESVGSYTASTNISSSFNFKQLQFP